jgi:hypothetical protein
MSHLVDDGELGWPASSHDDQSFTWRGECVVLARDREVEDLGWVDVLSMRDAVNEVLGLLESEFSGGKFLLEECLSAIDEFSVGISCHGGELLGSRLLRAHQR